MITVLEQAVPQAWRVDLMKRNDYATMTLAQVESYFKLLENIKETPPHRSGNDRRMSTTAPSTNRGNGGSNRRGNSGTGDRGRGRGNNRQGNRGGGRRTNNPTNQAPAQQQLHRCNRTRDPIALITGQMTMMAAPAPITSSTSVLVTLVIRRSMLLRNAVGTDLQELKTPTKHWSLKTMRKKPNGYHKRRGR
jgi:hypothetical protein